MLVLIVGFAGCQATAPKPKLKSQETMSDLTTVAQGLTDKPVTQAQLQALARQTAQNPQAQSALQAIGTAFSPEHTVKYCPENGERFSPSMTYCPDGKVKLEWVD